MTAIDKVQYLQIGVQGENIAMNLEFDMTAWAEQYPDATFHILFKPYNETEVAPQASSYDSETKVLTWTVGAGATAVVGVGYTEIRAQDGEGLIKKTRVIPTAVENSVSGVEVNPPAAYADWVAQVLNAGAAVIAAAHGTEVSFSIGTNGHLIFSYTDEDSETITVDLGPVDAYGMAVEAGYQRTRTQFEDELANTKNYCDAAEAARDAAQLAQAAAELAKTYAQLFTGAPRTAATAAAMEDTDKIYVYTGSTGGGLTNGHWYYHNGTAWTDGGAYNSTALTTDTTLAVSGAAADAKVTGDKLAEQKSAIDILRDSITDEIQINWSDAASISDPYGWEKGYYKNADGTATSSNVYIRTNKDYYFSEENATLMELFAPPGYAARASEYEQDGTYVAVQHGSNQDTSIGAHVFFLFEKGHKFRFSVGRFSDSTEIESKLADDDFLESCVAKFYVISSEADIEVIKEQINSINENLGAIFTKEKIEYTASQWRTGYYSKIDGTYKSSNKYLCTGSGVAIDKKNATRLTLEAPEGYCICAFEYTGGGTFVKRYGDFDTTKKTSIAFPEGHKFKLAIGKFTNASESLTDALIGQVKVTIDELKINESKPIRILGIGNSYTRDCLRWVWKILKLLGYDDVAVGHGYKAGITLEEQYNSLDASSSDHAAFTYWKYTTSQNATKTSGKTLDEIFADEPWDFVIFQQQSDEAGQYNSFVNDSFDINDFVSYIKTKIDNDALKIGLAMTWSHATGYTGERFVEYYGGDPAVQLAAIRTVIPQVANHMTQCDLIVNPGRAVELGRANTYLNAIGDEMLRSDKNHLDYGIPSFMAGLTYVLAITGMPIDDIYWFPTAEDEGVSSVTASEFLLFLAKQCAKNACLFIN